MSDKPKLLLIRFDPGKEGGLTYKDQKLRVLIGKLTPGDGFFIVFFSKGNQLLTETIQKITKKAVVKMRMRDFFWIRIDPHEVKSIIKALKEAFEVTEKNQS